MRTSFFHHPLALLTSAVCVVAACSPAATTGFDTGTEGGGMDAVMHIDATDTHEAAPPTDTVVPDTHVDVVQMDTRGTCTSDSDCHFDVNLPVCDTISHMCVHCTPTGPRICTAGYYCNAFFHCAPGCNTDSDCGSADAGHVLACDTAAHVCRGCVSDGDCALGSICSAGACVPGCNAGHDCPIGLTCCSGQCQNTSTDIGHCGSCTNICSNVNATPTCTAGMCMFTCHSGFGDCDHDPATGCEADLNSSTTNCGTCGIPCNTMNGTGGCMMGTCMLTSCNPGFQDCNGMPSDGCESNVQNDVMNCGTCGHACGPGEVCNAGVCGCPTGFMHCPPTSTTCVDTTTDVMNCGTCGTVCPTGMVCGSGTCTMFTTHYSVTMSPPGVTWIDACATAGHTEYLNGADDGSIQIPLPFPFHFWATDLAMGQMVNLCSNGWIGMDGMANSSLGGTIPSTATPNAVIAPHWGDDYDSTPGMCVALVGSAPRRQWVLEYNNQSYFAGTAMNTYEVILSESTNTIDFVYHSMVGTRSQIMGLENQAGTMAIGGCAAGATSCLPTSGQTVRFNPVP